MDYRSALVKCIETGFVDQNIHSLKTYRPELLTNDFRQGQKVLTSIIKELESCDQFWFAVAFITTGGVATLVNTLLKLKQNGIRGKILASQYLNFTQPEALRRILNFSNIELSMATEGEFHSKGFLFRKGDMYNLVIGSSNITQDALCSNKEWNLKVSATKESELINNAIEEFEKEFERSTKVTKTYLSAYSDLYLSIQNFNREILNRRNKIQKPKISPNKMQREALQNIELLRDRGKDKALLISATGTGKTYLSAFDVQRVQPKKFLFIVHRRTIALKSLDAFKTILGDDIEMGIYSGSDQDINADFIFSTVQTISKKEHLEKFSPDHFDYIVIDETHRAGAFSYTRVIDYFKPQFLMGMTATPERTDDFDVFEIFDHNIAYEIRLHKALEEEMLVPFHYYGITDLTINGEIIDDKTDFNLLTSNERIDRVIEKAEFYGCDDGVVRGLIFCSRQKECFILSRGFNQRGYKTIALTGSSTEEERQETIRRLESDDNIDKLDYIFTVDIFNEGVDIPAVNQIIMLRPTQSAIVFVQQLGRGLRITKEKQYLTVIDFIGNYSNNYLVPIALYGDTTYNKDSLRKILFSGSRLIPGSSTINFDEITQDKIFKAIDAANMSTKKDLVKDYRLLKFKLGYIPMMVDFIAHGSRDPKGYVKYSKSYFNFLTKVEEGYVEMQNTDQRKLLELFSNEINNAKRIEETILLRELIKRGKVEPDLFKQIMMDEYDYVPSDETIKSILENLNFCFVMETKNGKRVSVNELYDYNVVKTADDGYLFEEEFIKHLQNQVFKKFLIDTIDYAVKTYDTAYNNSSFHNGFILYEKYSRKDVFRILNWKQSPVGIIVGGYIISPDKTNCPIFVNYHKSEDISSTTKYDDRFINPYEFKWMSKSRRSLASNDVRTIRYEDIHLPLFVKKSNDEGKEFYYMGDITPIKDSFEEVTMPADNGKEVSVVTVRFDMQEPVADEIYEYITTGG